MLEMSSLLFAAGGDLKFEGGKKANCGSLHSRDSCIPVRHTLCALLSLDGGTVGETAHARTRQSASI